MCDGYDPWSLDFLKKYRELQEIERRINKQGWEYFIPNKRCYSHMIVPILVFLCVYRESLMEVSHLFTLLYYFTAEGLGKMLFYGKICK